MRETETERDGVGPGWGEERVEEKNILVCSTCLGDRTVSYRTIYAEIKLQKDCISQLLLQ